MVSIPFKRARGRARGNGRLELETIAAQCEAIDGLTKPRHFVKHAEACFTDSPLETQQRRPKAMKPAIAYLRTSSTANVGSDKDSDKRQRAAITAYAKRAGYRIVCEFYDAAVSGADTVDERAGLRRHA